MCVCVCVCVFAFKHRDAHRSNKGKILTCTLTPQYFSICQTLTCAVTSRMLASTKLLPAWRPPPPPLSMLPFPQCFSICKTLTHIVIPSTYINLPRALAGELERRHSPPTCVSEATEVSTPRHNQSQDDPGLQRPPSQQSLHTSYCPPTPHQPPTPHRPPTPYRSQHGEQAATEERLPQQQEMVGSARMRARRPDEEEVSSFGTVSA